MLAPDDVIANEGEVVTDKDPAAKGNADREALVVRVAQAQRVGVVAIGALQRHEAEVPGTVRCDGVGLLSYLVAEETERIAHQFNDFMVSHGNMGVRTFGVGTARSAS